MRKAITLTSLVSFASASVRLSSCNSWCQNVDADDGGYTLGGSVVGTAPSCNADCSGDCSSTQRCIDVDGGGGCWTGNKVCCCSGMNGNDKRKAALQQAFANDQEREQLALQKKAAQQKLTLAREAAAVLAKAAATEALRKDNQLKQQGIAADQEYKVKMRDLEIAEKKSVAGAAAKKLERMHELKLKGQMMVLKLETQKDSELQTRKGLTDQYTQRLSIEIKRIEKRVAKRIERYNRKIEAAEDADDDEKAEKYIERLSKLEDRMEAAISKAKKASTTNLTAAFRALNLKSLVKPVTTQVVKPVTTQVVKPVTTQALNRDLPIDQAQGRAETATAKTDQANNGWD